MGSMGGAAAKEVSDEKSGGLSPRGCGAPVSKHEVSKDKAFGKTTWMMGTLVEWSRGPPDVIRLREKT